MHESHQLVLQKRDIIGRVTQISNVLRKPCSLQNKALPSIGQGGVGGMQVSFLAAFLIFKHQMTESDLLKTL